MQDKRLLFSSLIALLVRELVLGVFTSVYQIVAAQYTQDFFIRWTPFLSSCVRELHGLQTQDPGKTPSFVVL